MIFDALDKILFTTTSSVQTASADKTSSGFVATGNSDTFALGTGGTGYTQPLYMVIRYSNGLNTTGSNTLQFDVQKSTTGTSGWVEHSSGEREKITLTNSPQAGIVNIPIETREGFVRLLVTISGAGSGSGVNVSADINIAPL